MKLVILPGLDGTGLLLRDFSKYLPDRWSAEVIAYPVPLVTYAEILDWLCTQLPRDNYVLIAESFSGPLAIEIAARNQENLKAVVYVATFARRPRAVPSFVAQFVRLFAKPSKAMARLSQPFLMGRFSNPDFTDQFLEAIGRIPAATLSGRLREVLRLDLTEKLRTCAVPSLYLGGEIDRLVPAKAAVEFVHSGSAFASIDAPHFVLQARAEAAAKIVIDFVDKLETDQLET